MNTETPQSKNTKHPTAENTVENQNVSAIIEQRIQEALSPNSLKIVDNSHAHHGHAGAKNGGGHYQLYITANIFKGKTSVERHRIVYRALEGLIGKEIHAVQIHAKTPEEDTL